MKPPMLRQQPPTAPGLYWYTLGRNPQLYYCRVMECGDGVRSVLGIKVDDSGALTHVSLFRYRFWAGPLPEPVEPS